MQKDSYIRACWWFGLLVLGIPLLIRSIVLLRASPSGLDAVVDFIYDDGYYYLAIAANFADAGRSTLDGVTPTNGYQPLWLIGRHTSAQLTWARRNVRHAILP